MKILKLLCIGSITFYDSIILIVGEKGRGVADKFSSVLQIEIKKKSATGEYNRTFQVIKFQTPDHS